MKISRRTLVVLNLFAVALSLFQSYSYGQTSDWEEDLRYLVEKIEEIHPKPNLEALERWKNKLDTWKDRTPELTHYEGVAEVSRLLVALNDGHSRLSHVRLSQHRHPELEHLQLAGFDTSYPIKFKLFSDGLYVTKVSEQYRELLGGKVVQINDHLPEVVFDSVRTLISSDNKAWQMYFFPSYLRSPGYLIAAGVGRNDHKLELKVERADGRSKHLLLEATAGDPNWVELRPETTPSYADRTSNFRFEFLSDSKTVYVRICEILDDDDQTIEDFSEELFKFVDDNHVDRLVFDIRGNGGGNFYLVQPLVLGTINATSINQKGKLFAIVDRGTFSAALMFAAELERNTNVLFVGEPTGSPANTFGDTQRFRLPNSNLEVKVSELYWQLSDPRDSRMALFPDVLAVSSFGDFKNGIDPCMPKIVTFQYAGRVNQPNRNWHRRSQSRGTFDFIEW